jgi:hypothetical protein
MYLGPNLPLGALQKPAKTPPKLQKPLPPPTKKIKQSGKVDVKWKEARRDWLIKYKPDENDNYICALCDLPVNKRDVTLDHIIPRSRAPHLRYAQENLQPAHYWCNVAKGSKVL